MMAATSALSIDVNIGESCSTPRPRSSATVPAGKNLPFPETTFRTVPVLISTGTGTHDARLPRHELADGLAITEVPKSANDGSGRGCNLIC